MYKVTSASEKDIVKIQTAAIATWNACYQKMIGQQQIDYMLSKFYSSTALQEQMKANHQFLLVETTSGDTCGFASYELNIQGEQKAKLHKLYVLPRFQKNQLGQLLLTEVCAQAKKNNQHFLILNVNRNNEAIAFYKHLGFEILKEEDIDIGEGYFMNDYVLQKKL